MSFLSPSVVISTLIFSFSLARKTPILSLSSDIPEDRSPVKVSFHWLVGTAFIVNTMPDKKKIVDHKDHNMHDYRISNLQWVTHQKNSQKRKLT